MTHREYELLKFLMLHRGVAYSRDDLLNYVWGYEYSGETRTVDVHIRQLRRKIEEDDANPQLIETVRGRGYRFRED
jgi:DNA-binding response OmpR family regulator